MCGGAYGRRKRSARRNLMKKMKRSPSLQKLVLDMASSKEGIDNEAFEIGMLNLIAMLQDYAFEIILNKGANIYFFKYAFFIF